MALTRKVSMMGPRLPWRIYENEGVKIALDGILGLEMRTNSSAREKNPMQAVGSCTQVHADSNESDFELWAQKSIVTKGTITGRPHTYHT